MKKKVDFDVIVTGISLNGYEIPVPPGLSELLNNAGAWVYEVPGTEVEEEEEEDPLKDYERKVVLENGSLRIYLTYKGKKTPNE
ncbi:hypothetical protein [Bacillus massiliglaciei]|uniref:hypothetical protein n=1 Tax=Bacillus massiliglaciei TaxID=1816693 RepID=UPI000DA62D5A|nr:hypothetical protein [Bacillus massiliglaciei]